MVWVGDALTAIRATAALSNQIEPQVWVADRRGIVWSSSQIQPIATGANAPLDDRYWLQEPPTVGIPFEVTTITNPNLPELANIACCDAASDQILLAGIEANGDLTYNIIGARNPEDQIYGQTWKGWQKLAPPPMPIGANVVSLLCLRAPDSRVVLVALDDKGGLWEVYQDAAGTGFNTWKSLSPPGSKTVCIAGTHLADGRFQLVGFTEDGRFWQSKQSSNAQAAPYENWHDGPKLPEGGAPMAICVAAYPDDTLGVWAVDSTSKAAIWSLQPSPRDPKVRTWASLRMGFAARSVCAARYQNGIMGLWATDRSGYLRQKQQLFPGPTARWLPWKLTFPMKKQERDNWCWAACATAVARFFDPTSIWTQASIANRAFNRSDYYGYPNLCNYPWYLHKALDIVGHAENPAWLAGPISLQEIRQKLALGAPVGVRIQWPHNQGAHFVMIHGVVDVGEADEWVCVQDPWEGRVLIAYRDLVSDYRTGKGS